MTTEQQQSAILEKWVNRILLGICAFLCTELFAIMKTQRNDIEQVKLSNARIEIEIKYIKEMMEPYRNNKDVAKQP